MYLVVPKFKVKATILDVQIFQCMSLLVFINTFKSIRVQHPNNVRIFNKKIGRPFTINK